MSKKKLIWVGCTLMGITFVFIICNLIANRMYKKQAIVYVEKVKSEYDTKLKDANESIEKLKNEFAETTKKEQESKQKSEEKNKEVAKESESKDTSTKKTESKNSTQKKEDPTNNPPKESPDLLKRSRLDKLDPSFWGTTFYYAHMYIHDVQSVTQSLMKPDTTVNEIKKWVDDNKKQLNDVGSMLAKIEQQGIPSACQSDYQKFKKLYHSYKNVYNNILKKGNYIEIDPLIYNKCQVILDEIGETFSKIYDTLK